MSRYIFVTLPVALALSGISFAHAAEELLPEPLQKIESLQRRADKLAFGELGSDNYHLAKARTWLDMALSEYYENEGNNIVAAAIVQIESLVDALEQKQTGISMDTPMQIDGSEAVRPDLWKKIAALKNSAQFSCGQRAVAEAEVHLVWAGHEKLESSWAHAESYARSAEDLLNEALTSINGCVAKIPVIEKIVISSDALFEFGAAELEPSVLWQLNRLADKLKMEKALQEVLLVGHTDRYGNPKRNQLLSMRRADSIKQYLAGKGIPAEKIRTIGAGSSQPVVQCPVNQSKAKQIACLRPNRRVEILLRGTK
jgi:outer membrane protein OmpA-like peptidoglycan-associated protein